MKHLDLQYSWPRDEVVEGTIPTRDMVTDILTKARQGRVTVSEYV
jgi:hypothetical protein